MKSTTDDSLLAALPSQIRRRIDDANRWLTEERKKGTLIAEETLWQEAYRVHLAGLPWVGERGDRQIWAGLAFELVFSRSEIRLNEKVAARQACRFLAEHPDLEIVGRSRKLHELAVNYNIDDWKLRALLGPGNGCPWIFPRCVWTAEVAAENLEALLVLFEWKAGHVPTFPWLKSCLVTVSAQEFAMNLASRAPADSNLHRILAAMALLLKRLAAERKDFCVWESRTFNLALVGCGLNEKEVATWHEDLRVLREAALLLASFQLYRRAESLVSYALLERTSDPRAALHSLSRAANIYKRLCVAQMFTERLLARHHRICRLMEQLRRQEDLEATLRDHVLLVSTCNSPADLQRLLVSVGKELSEFGYSRKVHVVISDESTDEVRLKNGRIIGHAQRRGMSISHWSVKRRNSFLDELNEKVFPDGEFDARTLAGIRKPGEKGVPYGRLRNFLRLAAMHDVRKLGLEEPIFTWLDQDNELGALVLTRAGVLSKRHAFNYFDQKSAIFSDPQTLIGGGGYTNDALEGVERFWVAWGILHQALGLARGHSPRAAPVVPPDIDITRFRPWEQPETLDRLPREGDRLETISDQFLILLNTLVGAFHGKYDNQVQIYHPWTCGAVSAQEELLVEQTRPFAGMPGGNTSFVNKILASSIPFVTVGGRGEDILHLWQVEGVHGEGTVRLTHSPVLHTRNVQSGRGNLAAEIIDSYNGRIFREPPYLWAAFREFTLYGSNPNAVLSDEVEAQTKRQIDALRNEAKSRIEQVSGFAAELERSVAASKGEWWVGETQHDSRYAQAMRTVRSAAAGFSDTQRLLRMADEKLLGWEDVKQLTAEFISAYPRWQTLVEHLGGGPVREKALDLGTPLRMEPYGAAQRSVAEDKTPAAVTSETPAESPVPASFEPTSDLPWQDAVISATLMFDRYEQGVIGQDRLLGWSERVTSLGRIYAHCADHVRNLPAFAWTVLFREALTIPNSAENVALGEMATDEFQSRCLREKEAEIRRLAGLYGADEDLLRQAQKPPLEGSRAS